MPQRIEFEGRVREFPDDFTQADIQRALTMITEQEGRGTAGAASPVLNPPAGATGIRAPQSFTERLYGRMRQGQPPHMAALAEGVRTGIRALPGRVSENAEAVAGYVPRTYGELAAMAIAQVLG